MKKFTILKKFNKVNENEVGTIVEPTDIESNKSLDISDESSIVVKFFSKLFESKEMAHVYHLRVKGEEGSYSDHIALGHYYEEVPDLIDELIEVYMGQYDVIEGYDIIDTGVSRDLDPLEYFMGISEFIKSEKYRAIPKEDTHLHSIIDMITSLVYRLTYKLKYNK